MHDVRTRGPNDGSALVADNTLLSSLPFQAYCSCGWNGLQRSAHITARIDAKTHRIDTAFEDDSNIRTPTRNTPK